MYGFPRCVKALKTGTVVAINKLKKKEEKKERKIDGKLRDIKDLTLSRIQILSVIGILQVKYRFLVSK